jgi:hypothetical protein
MNDHAPKVRPCAGAAARFMYSLIGCVSLGSAILMAPRAAAAPDDASSTVWVRGWVETIRDRVKGAEVVLRTLDGKEIGRSRGLTNRRGVFAVFVKGALPAEFVAEAHGGSLGDAVLSAVVEDYDPTEDHLYIDPATTMVARELGDHPADGLSKDEANVEHYLGLPPGDESLSRTQLSNNPDFNASEFEQDFERDRAANGNLSKFIGRMEVEMDSKPSEVLLAPGSADEAPADTAPPGGTSGWVMPRMGDSPEDAPMTCAGASVGSLPETTADITNFMKDQLAKFSGGLNPAEMMIKRYGITPSSTSLNGINAKAGKPVFEKAPVSAQFKPTVSPVEVELGGTSGFSPYQFLSDFGSSIGSSILNGLVNAGTNLFVGFFLDAIGLGTDSGADLRNLQKGIDEIQAKLDIIGGQLTALGAEHAAWARLDDKKSFDLAEAKNTDLKRAIRSANAQLEVIADWYSEDSAEDVLDTFSKGYALMEKYNLSTPDINTYYPNMTRKLSDEEQNTLLDMTNYLEGKKNFQALAKTCLANIDQLHEYLVGGSANEAEGGYRAFNRVVYNSQYFWTKTSSTRVREYFLEYDFYQATQYNMAVEYLTSTYSFGTGKNRRLVDSIIPAVVGLITVHDIMRQEQAEMMAPYLKSPPPFEAIDPNTRSSWMSTGASPSLGRSTELALDLNSVNVKDIKFIDVNNFGPATVNYKEWQWDGNFERFHLPSKAEVEVLQKAWQRKNSNLPDSSKLSFYGWLQGESAKGGRETWTAGDLEEALKTPPVKGEARGARVNKRLDVGSGGRDESAPEFKNFQENLRGLYGQGIVLHFANTEKTLFTVNYWPAEGNTLWWTSTNEAGNTPILYPGFYMVSRAAKVFVTRFDAGNGNFWKDPIGMAWCTVEGNASGGYYSRYAGSTTLKDMMTDQLWRQRGNMRDGGYYVQSGLMTFGGVLIPLRQLRSDETYWMPGSRVN